MLSASALALLHKCAATRQHYIDDYDQAKFKFSTLIPAWAELNRACFWFAAEKSREELNRRGQHLTELHQVWMFTPFWNFKESDFEYALQQVTERSLHEEKLLALSLAFRLYVAGGRDRKQRQKIKKIVAADSTLAERLSRYLKPPAQGRQQQQQLEASYNRRFQAQKRKEAKNRDDWRAYLQANAHQLRNNGLQPGQLSNAQCYLLEILQEKNERSGQWMDGNWRSLIRQFGDEVAQAFRDGAIRFWREYTPKLRSEGAPANSTPYAVIFGLFGLQVEMNENSDWMKGLSSREVELACRYASYELNGFPAWFPALFKAFPSDVKSFLIKEVRYELSIETPDVDSHYILNDISWSGKSAWNELASEIYAILEVKEPTNFSNLGHLLNIIQGSSISNDEIAKLALRKSQSLEKLDHLAQWFAVWVGSDPDFTLPALANHLKNFGKPEDCTALAMQFITQLTSGCRGRTSNIRNVFHTPKHLKDLYLLMHQYIHAKDDIKRTGAYHPGLRDDAQNARDTLAELIRSIPGKEAFGALMEIANAHTEENYRPWFIQQAKAKAEMDADIQAWSPRQVRDFYDKLDRTPANHRDLAELAHSRFLDLKDDLEHGDSSIAGILKRVTFETDMRKYVGGVLRDKAFGRYSIPQEEELADSRKPDLRFQGANFDGPVPCELKLADNWTGPALLERLENQLCGDYLRDNRSNRGFFILVYRGEKHSWEPDGTTSVNFDGLVKALEKHWEKISINYPNVDHIEVVGIDLTKRSN